MCAVVSTFEPEFSKGASASVLRCLQARYMADTFYTNAGCTLVALNPFKPVPQLYSLELMREYHTAPQPQVRQLLPGPQGSPSSPEASLQLPHPHPFMHEPCNHLKSAGATALPSRGLQNFGHMTVGAKWEINIFFN